VGQKLAVYPGPDSKVSKLVHEVRSGDTLWEIAHAHGVAVADLQKWNELGNRSTIRIGQTLTIYTGSGAGSTTSTGPRTVTHKVVKGETLWDIARKYNVSVDAIKSWNDLRRDTLYIGQKLTLKL
jgi:membrane-bound lytic murein transglycosylase D